MEFLTSLTLGPGEAVDARAAVGADAPAPVLAAVLTHSCEGKQRIPSLLLLESTSRVLAELGMSPPPWLECQTLEHQLRILPPGASTEKSEIFVGFFPLEKLFPDPA